MNNSWIIAKREFFERIKSSSFKWMLFIGPLTLLLLTFIMVKSSEKAKKSIDAVVTDPSYLFTNRQILKGESVVDYTIQNKDFTINDFNTNSDLSKFDAWVEINPKVLNNKVVKVFCREEVSTNVRIALQLDIERRLEEALVENDYLNVSMEEFRRIKQPMNFDFINLNKPNDDKQNYRGYVGLVFGSIIVLFIALFGMSILRSTAKEKSNRIVEVILASVKPMDLMLGKIIGVGLSALLQFILWSILILIGLLIFRETIFPDIFDPSTWAQSSQEVATQLKEQLSKTKENKFLEVIYQEIDYTVMVSNFILLFVCSYVFYGAFYSWMGAMSNSESDGQQFTLPILGILFFSLFMGYIQIQNPDSSYLTFFAYFPFTSAVIQLVRIAQGYYVDANTMEYFTAILFLILSTSFLLYLAGKWYKTNILNFSGKRKWVFWQSKPKV